MGAGPDSRELTGIKVKFFLSLSFHTTILGESRDERLSPAQGD